MRFCLTPAVEIQYLQPLIAEQDETGLKALAAISIDRF